MEESEWRLLAQTARRNLAELIPDADERHRADGDLARALGEPPGEAKPALMEALRAHEGVRRWMAADPLRAVNQLGDLTEAIVVLYVCPNEDYTVALDAPPDGELLCPHDGEPLTRYAN